MAEAKEIPSNTDCFICGDVFVIRTEVEQKRGFDWYACDGDEAYCPDCGAKAWVSADGERAYINWDEESDHNVKAAEKYEASKK